MPCKYTHRVPLCNTTYWEARSSCATTPPPNGHGHRPQLEANPTSFDDNTTNANPIVAIMSTFVIAKGPQTLATNGPPPTAVPALSLAPF